MKTTPATKITQERLKELLSYDPDTGVFTRKRGKNAGCIAGGFSDDGYLKIGVDGRRYFAHRLAWLYVEGYLPENMIDHINRLKDDNRRCNLREVSKACNMHNSGIPKNNTSGVKGVSWASMAHKWRAQIKSGGKVYGLGTYDSFTMAVMERYRAEIKYGFTNCDTASSAKQYLIEHGIDVDNMTD